MPANSNFVIRPVAEPRVIDDVYSDDQHARMMKLAREKGPWKMILALHFNSPEEVVATTSGAVPEGVELTWDMFLTPNFRGYLAQGGVSLYPELDDLFYNPKHLARIRSFWNAQYAEPENMNFVIQGPSSSSDPGHLDATEFRGITESNTPIWLMNTMTKSGLFQKWILKKAQIVAWFFQGTIGGGFTYWPEGPHAAPKRVASPMWNRAVVSQNEMMFHRGEANGPLEKRQPKGLSIDSLLHPDPEIADGWLVKTGDTVIQTISGPECRLMVHWDGSVYRDLDEMKLVLEHKDDLTHDQVFDMFMKDLREQGVSFNTPTDPLHDREFIGILTRAYDIGLPTTYPAEAPGPGRDQLAA